MRLLVLLTLSIIVIVKGNPRYGEYECSGGNKWRISQYGSDAFCYGLLTVGLLTPRNIRIISDNICNQQFEHGSAPASIHSDAENTFLENNFGSAYIGLYQPENGPWNPHSWQWSDGTPLNYTNWDLVNRPGLISPQPSNQLAPERVVRLRLNNFVHGWHDWNALFIDHVICKKRATKFAVPTQEFECPGGNKWRLGQFGNQGYCYGLLSVGFNTPKNIRIISDNICNQWFEHGSAPASIHSDAENSFLETHYGSAYIGLYQPENGPWNRYSWQWSDGTRLDYTNWDLVNRPGLISPQPSNQLAPERVVKLRLNNLVHGWHDWNALFIDKVICKKNATRINRPNQAPPVAAPIVPTIPPATTTTSTTTTTTVPTTQKPRNTCRV